MIAKRLDGRRESARLLRVLTKRVKRQHRRITLATILVGQRYDSALYVKLKRQAAASAGMRTEYHHLAPTTNQAALERLIGQLNRRSTIDGILLQLPLPSQLDVDRAIAVMRPSKDVDGFHPANTVVVPPPVAAVLRLVAMGRPARGAFACLVAQPSVFSDRLAVEMERIGYAVATVEPYRGFGAIVSRADIVVTALGTGRRLTARDIKRGAIVVDVGIRKHGKKTAGDVDQSVWTKAKAISPVPGGVGPLTVAYVLWNTYTLARQHG